jgi:hypothetical protein
MLLHNTLLAARLQAGLAGTSWARLAGPERVGR